jgi:hypothetical protein
MCELIRVELGHLSVPPGLHQSIAIDVGFPMVSWWKLGSYFRAQTSKSPTSFLLFLPPTKKKYYHHQLTPPSAETIQLKA